MQEINKNLLQYLNWLWEIEFFRIFVQIFVDGPIFILPVFLLWYWIYYSFLERNKKDTFDLFLEKKQDLIFIFYWTVFALIISLIIQQFVNIDRPEQHIKAGAKLLLDHLPDASFPSDHASVGIAFITWLFFSWYKKWFWLLLLPFIFMIISRVIAWVHWPFDILAWSLIWTFGSYIAIFHFSKIKFVKKLNLEIIKLLNYIKL